MAYWVGGGNVAITVPGSGAVWVVPAAGGPAAAGGREFDGCPHSDLVAGREAPAVHGYTSAKAFDSSSLDWWLVATGGGDAVRTGAYEALVEAGLLRTSINPSCPCQDVGPRPPTQ